MRVPLPAVLQSGAGRLWVGHVPLPAVLRSPCSAPPGPATSQGCASELPTLLLALALLPSPGTGPAAGDAHVGGVGRVYSRPKKKHVGCAGLHACHPAGAPCPACPASLPACQLACLTPGPGGCPVLPAVCCAAVRTPVRLPQALPSLPPCLFGKLCRLPHPPLFSLQRRPPVCGPY